MKLILGITGASGAIYAKRIIEILSKRKLAGKIKIVFTDAGKQVWTHEIKDMKISEIPFEVYDNKNFFVDIASGSSGYDAMIVCPCSMGTMAKIANGIADNLLTRAADVMLKENKKLIIVPREMPYNLTHIKNMEKLFLNGAKICPASPSFYSLPGSIDDLVNSVVQKVLNLAGFDVSFYQWKSEK